MLPYLTLERIPVLNSSPFAFLVSLAMIAGYIRSLRDGKAFGISARRISDLFVLTIIPSLIGAHVFQILVYDPQLLSLDPIQLLKLGSGVSSFGGIFSGAVLVWLYVILTDNRSELRLWGDIITQGVVLGFFIGRIGCVFAHDHPGVATDFFLAVKYPNGPRHDLGLYEFIYISLVILPVSVSIARARLKPGTHIAVIGLLYGVFRLFFDALRIGEVKYFGFVPGQYCGLLMLVMCGLLFRRLYFSAEDEARSAHSP